MNYRTGALAALLLGLTAAWAGAEAADTAVPPEIAARLPKYCVYELDLSALAQPHAALGAATEEGDETCPFLAGSKTPVRVFRSAGKDGCAPAPFAGLTVLSVQTLDGRGYRRQAQCASAPASGAPLSRDQQGGRVFLLSYAPPPRPRFDQPGWDRRLAQIGAPIAVVAEAAKFRTRPVYKEGTRYLCIQLLPGVTDDALGVLRATGQPLPADIRQQEITGQDCVKALTAKVGRANISFSGAMARQYEEREPNFTLALSAPDELPVEDAPRLASEVLARHGARAADGSILVPGQVNVLRLADGGYLGVSGGAGMINLDLRRLSPEVCRIAFDIATAVKSDLDARPPYLAFRIAGEAKPGDILAADAADLCALLQPGFDEWRAQAPDKPDDLSDLDGGMVMFGRGVTQASKPDS